MAAAPRKRALKSAIRFFLLVCGCLALCLVVATQGRNWLVHRLTSDFDSLSGQEKKQRLVELAELGPAAIPSLVESLAEPEIDVARTAYELLQQSQNDWTVLEESQRSERHAVLVNALQAIAIELPDDRTGWGTSLLQATLIASVGQKTDRSRELYRDANHALELFSLSERSGSGALGVATTSQVVAASEQDLTQPMRLSVRAQPLPVDQSRAADAWTQWPPSPEATSASEVTAALAAEENVLRSTSEDSAGLADSPVIYRSGARLRPIDREEDVLLDELPDRSSDIHQVHDQRAQAAFDAEIQAATHLVDSPLETYDDPSVIRWLGSEHATLRERAETELARRGYGQAELSLARQLASANNQTKLELVNVIASSNQLDPRPWLLMLLEDPNRDVKLRTISVLATMDDPSINHQLQVHLAEEQDPTVAARIRRVLKLR